MEGGGLVAEEDEAALRSGEAEGVLDHGVENVVEDAAVVEALSGLEEEGELFKLGARGGARDAVQQGARCGLVLRSEEDENDA